MKAPKFLIAIALINLIFFLPYFIYPKRLTTLDNDLGRTYIPIYSFIKKSVKTYGQLPLWRPDQMMGESFISSPLSTVVYPPNILFVIFPVHFAAILFLFLHFLLASIATFFLARAFSISSHAAFAAAVFFAFSTKMLVHLEAGHITMVAAFSYFPLVLLATKNICRNIQPRHVVIGAISLSAMLMLYATVFYYSIIFLALYVLYEIFLKNKNTANINFLFRKFKLFFILGFLTLGFSAIFLLPLLEFGPISSRSTLTYQDVAIPIWSKEKLVRSLVFPYPEVASFNHEAFLYLGAIPLIFAAYGFFHLGRRQQIIIGSVSALTLLFVAGQSTPIFKIAYDYIPFLKYSRVTTRLWFVVALMAALLAAYGLKRVKNQKIIYFAIFIFLAESLLILTLRLKNLEKLDFANDQIYSYLAKDSDLFRIYCTTYCFNPQLLSQYQIQMLAGETPIQNKNFINFLSRAGNYNYQNFAVIFPPYQIWQVPNPPVPNSDLLSLANVKYITSTYDIKDLNYILIGNFDNLQLYENKNFKPRYYIENSNERVTIVKITPNRVSLAIENTTYWQTLMISQNYYPGLWANIDGKNYKVEKHQEVFQKVAIPPNTQTIIISFLPESFKIGRTITFGTIILIAMWYIHHRKNGDK